MNGREIRVRVDSMGCRVNRYDAAELRGQLAAAGYEVVDADRPYDVYVLNTCTVTHVADAETHKLLSRARREAPLAKRVLTGCYADALGPKPSAGLAMAPSHAPALAVDLIVTNREKPNLTRRLDELLGPAAPGFPGFPGDRGSAGLDHARPVAKDGAAASPLACAFPRGPETRFFLKVQEGCDVRCAFCIIPDTRGSSRSIAPERIFDLVGEAVRRGYREVVLVGIHLGAYGRDLATAPSLAGLVAGILDKTSIERVRLGSLEPWGVRPDLIDLLAHEPRFLPMLHLPLQSGCERILSAMGRPMTAARYRQTVQKLFAAQPELALYLDVLVGFPGETDADFEETMALLRDFPWTKLHVFPYSARQGTPAAELANRVPAQVVQARVRKLIDWSDGRFSMRMAGRVGSTCEVLMEAGGVGHTRDHFPCRIDGVARNTLIKAELVDVDVTSSDPVLIGRWAPA